jgi:hypothetical protein
MVSIALANPFIHMNNMSQFPQYFGGESELHEVHYESLFWRSFPSLVAWLLVAFMFATSVPSYDEDCMESSGDTSTCVSSQRFGWLLPTFLRPSCAASSTSSACASAHFAAGSGDHEDVVFSDAEDRHTTSCKQHAAAALPPQGATQLGETVDFEALALQLVGASTQVVSSLGKAALSICSGKTPPPKDRARTKASAEASVVTSQQQQQTPQTAPHAQQLSTGAVEMIVCDEQSSPAGMSREIFLVVKDYGWSLRYSVNLVDGSDELDLEKPMRLDWVKLREPFASSAEMLAPGSAEAFNFDSMAAVKAKVFQYRVSSTDTTSGSGPVVETVLNCFEGKGVFLAVRKDGISLVERNETAATDAPQAATRCWVELRSLMWPSVQVISFYNAQERVSHWQA